MLANPPSGTSFSPDVLLFLTPKTGNMITKVSVSNKETPITTKETAVEFSSKFGVDEIGQLDLLMSAPVRLQVQENAISLQLMPKLADTAEVGKKTVKYCFAGAQGREIQSNVLYTLTVCPNSG